MFLLDVTFYYTNKLLDYLAIGSSGSGLWSDVNCIVAVGWVGSGVGGGCSGGGFDGRALVGGRGE